MIRPVTSDGQIETGGAFAPIARPRVSARIAAAARERITLIAAPAGFGKTVALRAFLETYAGPVARFDVRAEHATLLAFLRGFSLALAPIAPDLVPTLPSAYERCSSGLDAVDDLASWMDAHLASFNGMIAIDDLHRTDGADGDVSAFLAALIDRTKMHIRWIVATRNSFELPVATWLAYADMDMTIDERDLAFTLDEARLAAKASKLSVRDEELSAILKLTEGWPFALSFALRWTTRSVDLENVSANTRELVYAYLAEQVYRALTEEESALLAVAALLPEIDVNVLRHAGFNHAIEIIDALRRRVSFVYAEGNGIFRCHDLFRDFIIDRNERKGSEHFEALQIRAARALEASGAPLAALLLFTHARALDDVMRLLERDGVAAIDRGEADVIAGALDLFDQKHDSLPPIVAFLKGLVASLRGASDQGRALLKKAFEKAAQPQLRVRIATRLAMIDVTAGREVEAAVLAALDAPCDDLDLSGEAIAAKAAALARQRESAGSQAAIARALEVSAELEGDDVRARILEKCSLAAMDCGDIEQSYDLGKRAAEFATSSKQYSVASKAYILVGIAETTLRDDVHKYVDWCEAALKAARLAGDAFDVQATLIGLGNAMLRLGDLTRAVEIAGQLAALRLHPVIRSIYFPVLGGLIAGWDSRYRDSHLALNSVWQRLPLCEDRAQTAAICALMFALDERSDEAKATVAAALAEIEAAVSPYQHNRRSLVVAVAFCALAEFADGRKTSANRLLGRLGRFDDAVARAIRSAVGEACEYPMRAVHDAAEGANAFETLADEGYGGIGRLIALVAAKFMDEEPVTSTTLTPSELAVLRDVANGASPKQIAIRTGRSLTTVQTQIQKAMVKLGCHSRTEAVATARRLGMLV